MFEAPPHVKHYFDCLRQVSRVPVLATPPAEMLETIVVTLLRNNIYNFYTDDRKYILKRSRFSDDTITIIQELNPPKYLVEFFDRSQYEKARADFENISSTIKQRSQKIAEFEEKIKNIERAHEQLLQRKHECNLKLAQKAFLKTKLDQKKASLDSITAMVTEMCQSKNNLLATVQAQMADVFKKFAASMSLLAAQDSVCGSIVQEALTFASCSECLSQCQKQFARSMAIEKEDREALERMAAEVEVKLKNAQQQQQVACESLKIGPVSLTMDLPTSLKKAFEKLPNSIEELQSLIERKRATVASTECMDSEETVREYASHVGDSEAVETDIEVVQAKITRLENNAKAASIVYLEEVRDLVEKINSNFASFLKILDFAGEVVFDEGNDVAEYSQYGISIKVKFRADEPLKVLNAQHQSGGERSLSTILYVFALQEVSQVPFCCVDEINQGMDQTNERMIFELMFKLLNSRAASANSETIRSQYFMLTPKVLNNLSYGPNLRVWFVYNGTNMVSGNKWNISDFCAKIK